MSEQTFNERLLDAMIAHQIGLLQFSGGLRNRIWAILDRTEVDLRRQVRNANRAGYSTPARVRRTEKILSDLRETRVAAWTEVKALWFEELTALAVAEAGFFDGIITGTFPVELGTTVPSASRLRDIAKARPFMGSTLKEWGEKMQAADVARIEDAVKVGLVQGEAPAQISRRLVGTARRRGTEGVTQITRRHAATLARTVSSGIASETRRAYLEVNDDLAPTWAFIATLDSRTTPICQRWDGTVHKVGEGPRLPLHFGERSTEAPIVDGEIVGQRPRRDFTEQQLVREYAKENGLDVKVPPSVSGKEARNRLPRGHKGSYDEFARRRMRELTGRTPAKTSYGEWLSRQSASNQADILGPTRARLFRQGDLKIDRFVEDSGRTLTLPELAAKHAEAFSKAGLDASSFL